MAKENKQQVKFHQQINETFSKLSDVYLERLTDPSIEISLLSEFAHDLKTRWKTYCTIKRLNREAFFALDKYIEHVDQKHSEAIANNLAAPELEPEPEMVK
jgi:hypothetical protein